MAGHPTAAGERQPQLNTIRQFWDYVVNMDVYLAQLVEMLGGWIYVVIFAVIFLETGIVIAPWLPGESLLIGAGTLAGSGLLNIYLLAPLMFGAAFLGDLSNYLIGRFIGHRLTSKPRRFIKPEHVAQAHEFYEKHGGLAIVLARFMPVVRTLAPFVAGGAGMNFQRFLFFDAIASALWVTIFLGAGYWFGTVPWVQDNLALVLLGVVLLSITPSIIGYIVRRIRMRRAARTPTPPPGADEDCHEGEGPDDV
jgi:membrane-associated protein